MVAPTEIVISVADHQGKGATVRRGDRAGKGQAAVALDAVRMRARTDQAARKAPAADRTSVAVLAADHPVVVAPRGAGVLDSDRRVRGAGQPRAELHQDARPDVQNGVTMNNWG